MKGFNQIATSTMLAAGLLALPLSGMAAEGLSYGYLEIDYVNLDVDEPGDDVFDRDFDNGGGWGIQASVPLTDTFFIFGGYSDTEADFSFFDNAGVLVPGDTDVKRFDIGVGFALPINDMSDLVLRGAYSDIDYDDFDFGAGPSVGLGDLDDDPSDGFFVDVAWRAQFTNVLEGSIGARYTEIENLDGLSLIGNLMYEFSPNLGINLSVDAGDDLMTWGLGARYSF